MGVHVCMYEIEKISACKHPTLTKTTVSHNEMLLTSLASVIPN